MSIGRAIPNARSPRRERLGLGAAAVVFLIGRLFRTAGRETHTPGFL